MPSVYLSPSVQHFNTTILGESEEYFMNLIADAMIPYLEASGISYGRNDPGMTLSQVIAQSNAGNYDFHLALHSNAAPEHLTGILYGPDVYYYPASSAGRRAAAIFAENLQQIYPDPAAVGTVASSTLAELRRVRVPANLIEIAYHDNWADAVWIAENIQPIAANLVLSLTQYFGIPFVQPY